jgi:hypothetical protein
MVRKVVVGWWLVDSSVGSLVGWLVVDFVV